MNKTQTKRLQKFLALIESTPLATRDTYATSAFGGEMDLYTPRRADEKGRPTIGVLAAKLDKNVRSEEAFLSNVGLVALFLENLGFVSEDTFDAAERIVNASAGTHSPVQNSKRAVAALRRYVERQTVAVEV